MAIVALNSTARNVSIAVMTRQNSTRRLGAFTAQPTTLISKRSVVRRAENEEQQPSTSEQVRFTFPLLTTLKSLYVFGSRSFIHLLIDCNL